MNAEQLEMNIINNTDANPFGLSVLKNKGVMLVFINGIQVYCIEMSDKITYRQIAVELYLTHKIDQQIIATSWEVTIRTVNKWITDYQKKGVDGLRDKQQGRPVLIDTNMRDRIIQLREQKYTIYQIAQITKLSPRSVNKAIAQETPSQTEFTELQNSSMDAEKSEILVNEEEITGEKETGNASKIDPLNRSADRMAAVAGIIEDANPIFADSEHVEGAGSLLAVAAMANTGFLKSIHRVYQTLGPAFYGLRNVFMTLFFMAVLRIDNPERLNQLNVKKIGRLLGLDRSPSVKTIRRKIRTLGARNQAGNLMNLRSKEIMSQEHFPDAVLFVDGHIQCYSGNKKIGKTFSNNKNRVVKGNTDYWVNLEDGTPLLCITSPFNEHLNKMLPKIIRKAQKNCPNRRITLVFDRGGADGATYELLIKSGCDFIAYHKNPQEVDYSVFKKEKTIINNREYDYAPHERDCEVPVYQVNNKGNRRKTNRVVHLREIIIRRKDDKCTHVITTRKDLAVNLVCSTLFSRWTQENFFKYMISTYNLDHLYTYQSRQVPADLDHPNPEYVQLQKQKKKIRTRIAAILGKQLDRIAENQLEELAKLHKGKKAKELKELAESLKLIDNTLKITPKRETAQDFEMLEPETRLIGNLVKMTAWDAEGILAGFVGDISKSINGNERGIVEAFMQTTGSLKVVDRELQIVLQSQSTPERTRLLEHVCSVITSRQVSYPGSKLKMIFSVDNDHLPKK